MSTVPTRALARRIVELACRAPSVHNSQPWRWRVIDDTTIDLYADRSRQLRVSDSPGRSLAMSCGAAVHHSSIAAEAFGLSINVELEPAPEDDSFLARITLSPGTPHVDSAVLLQDLEDRCTDRRRYTSWPIPDSRLLHLAKAAEGWGAHGFAIVDVTKRFRAEELLEQAMGVQAADPRFAEEQSEWIDRSQLDGIPMVNATPPALGRPPTHPNRFASATRTTATEAPHAARVVEGSDGLMAICTARDDQRSWLQAGQALSALWLRATREGLSIVPLSQLSEVEETREALRRDVFDDMASPQILLRVGWLELTRGELERTPRRPVDDVIEG